MKSVAYTREYEKYYQVRKEHEGGIGGVWKGYGQSKDRAMKGA